VVLLVIALESLGFQIAGSLVDVVSMSAWTVVTTLLVVGFFAGRWIERLVRSRHQQRQRHRI
jgi:hypothetical protein